MSQHNILPEYGIRDFRDAGCFVSQSSVRSHPVEYYFAAKQTSGLYLLIKNVLSGQTCSQMVNWVQLHPLQVSLHPLVLRFAPSEGAK